MASSSNHRGCSPEDFGACQAVKDAPPEIARLSLAPFVTHERSVEVGLSEVGAEHLVLDVGGRDTPFDNALRTACMNAIVPAQVVPGGAGQDHVGEVHQSGACGDQV